MIQWLCFEWKTDALPKTAPAVDPLVLRPALPDDEQAVSKALKSAFSMDSIWGDVAKPLDERLSAAVEAQFSKPDPSCVVLVHGARVIGTSLLDVEKDATNHLLSGPCVLHEYRNRGLASCLLYASLEFLATNGVAVARGLTRANSITARFVYPKFGGASRAFQGDPLKEHVG